MIPEALLWSGSFLAIWLNRQSGLVAVWLHYKGLLEFNFAPPEALEEEFGLSFLHPPPKDSLPGWERDLK